jgi:hypothetical protein
LFGASSYEHIWLGNDTDDTSSDFVVDNHVVFADNINAEFLTRKEKK